MAQIAAFLIYTLIGTGFAALFGLSEISIAVGLIVGLGMAASVD